MDILAGNSGRTIVNITPRTLIRVLFACMALLVVFGLAGQVSRFLLGHDYLLGLLPKFDLDAENNVPTSPSPFARIPSRSVNAAAEAASCLRNLAHGNSDRHGSNCG
jgi:hypothetical protein